jgi:hypothetical protein
MPCESLSEKWVVGHAVGLGHGSNGPYGVAWDGRDYAG